ncbi:MAG: hypothetical protein A3F18_01075 [Legionellales bacterium RIFCSPHIGHO2_12_FULL_37_14]|nr:MAG: hypothetical protein A3F18_01075 [Legionellales bacterium RIFCSPHIGHO2_12_FULL_37_14]
MSDFKDLGSWISSLAKHLAKDSIPEVEMHPSFIKHENFIYELIDKIQAFPEEITEEIELLYSASLMAFDICVAELKGGVDALNKPAIKLLDKLMAYLAEAMHTKTHSLGFYLPLLNSFYETKVELSSALQQAYFAIADREDLQDEKDVDYLAVMQEMLQELADLSIFDIAEHIFSQSHAMQPDFYFGLIFDLCNIKEGHEVALMFLLHPNQEVRAIAILVLDEMIANLDLSPLALSRLKSISHWYAEKYQDYFARWLKIQRKKGCFYAKASSNLADIKWYATEIDGSGSQGLFIYIKQKRQYRLCGLLVKYAFGIKDVWITSPLSKQELIKYRQEAFDHTTTLRLVTQEYTEQIVNHFLGVMHSQNALPSLYLLQIQEILGIEFVPLCIFPTSLIQELGVQIVPFTQEVVKAGVRQSKNWERDKPIVQSWFEESPAIDHLVNKCCSYVNGVKICAMDEAINLVREEVFSQNRAKWVFHFLWMALWAKANAGKKERFWKDCFFIACALNEGEPLENIPVINDMVELCVLNSLETMKDRRSHLSLS